MEMSCSFCIQFKEETKQLEWTNDQQQQQKHHKKAGKGTRLEKNTTQGTQVHWLIEYKFNKTVIEWQDDKRDGCDEKKEKRKQALDHNNI